MITAFLPCCKEMREYNMLVQLKCKACNSNLKAETDSNTFVCEYCGSRYIFADREHREAISLNLRGSNSSDLSRYITAIEERMIQAELAEIERQRIIDEENERERRRLAEVDRKANWIRNNLCRHCGGEFEGRFFKKCKSCGKSKDY